MAHCVCTTVIPVFYRVEESFITFTSCIQVIFDPNKYFENVLSTLRAATKENLNELRKPVDKTR